MVEARLSVVMVAGHVDRRGEVRRLAGRARRLRDRGIACRVACLGGAPALNAEGLDTLENAWIGRRWLLPLAARQLVLADPARRPDVVHIVHDDVAEAGALLAGLWRAPVVRTVEDFPPPGLGPRPDPRRCRAVVVGAETLRRHLVERLGMPADRVHLIRPGIEPPPDQESADDVGGPEDRLPVIGTMGSFRDGHGPDMLLDAVHRIVEAGRDVELLVAGIGPGEDAARRRAERLGIADRLTFAGPAALEGAFWRVIDLYCQATTAPTVALPMAIAMATGTPCVAADVEGVADLLGRGEQGVLVPPADPTAIARALIDVIDRPSVHRGRAIDAARWALERYDPAREADALAALYDRIAAAGSDRGARTA